MVSSSLFSSSFSCALAWIFPQAAVLGWVGCWRGGTCSYVGPLQVGGLYLFYHSIVHGLWRKSYFLAQNTFSSSSFYDLSVFNFSFFSSPLLSCCVVPFVKWFTEVPPAWMMGSTVSCFWNQLCPA